MTIRIPDDLARELAEIAAVRGTSVEQLAVERLRQLIERPTFPKDLLQALRGLPHPSSAAVDDLESSIADGKLPVQEHSLFK